MKHHEPAVIGCSCNSEVCGIKLYVQCAACCALCGTWYTLTRDGHIQSTDAYHREPGPSHAVRVEWPA